MVKPPFMTADPLCYGLLKEYANENRKHQTEAERCLWDSLRNGNTGYSFKRQHIVGMYIADFICIEARLIIEVDGGYHSQWEQMEVDANRTHVLEQMGFRVIRFSNEEIIGDIDNVLDVIISTIEQLQ